jgi:hypothetical protein
MIAARIGPDCSPIRLAVFLLFLPLALANHPTQAQSGPPASGEPNETWAGRRIVTLEGFGDYFVSGDHGQSELIRPEGLAVNIVAVAQRLEGDRIWIKANRAGDVPVGWVNKKNTILLDDAIPYFTSLIEHNPKDWDAYLRRAESEIPAPRQNSRVSAISRCVQRFCILTSRLRADDGQAGSYRCNVGLGPTNAHLVNA